MIQTHHISYDPEVTVTISKGEHQRIHKHHGVGRAKGEARLLPRERQDEFLSSIRRLSKTGDSRIITIPPEWVLQHDLVDKSPDLQILYDDVILILPPKFSMDKKHIIEKKLAELEEEAEKD